MFKFLTNHIPCALFPSSFNHHKINSTTQRSKLWALPLIVCQGFRNACLNLPRGFRQKKNIVIQSSKSKWEIKPCKIIKFSTNFAVSAKMSPKRDNFCIKLKEYIFFIIKGEHFYKLCKIMRIA